MDTNTRNDKRWIFIVLLLFIGSTALRGALGDFPKALRIYPDELRYVSIAKSLINGHGIQIHNMESDFQKILYSLCIMPAFLLDSSVGQIRLIGYLNSVIVSSSIIPVYLLCKKASLDIKSMSCMLIFWATLPTLLVNMYFMSEVIYLPLSLWVVYCAWCAFEAERPDQKIRLNVLLGILCYFAYLCKEIAIYFILSYIIVSAARIFMGRAAWKKEAICLICLTGTFVLCFVAMKMTLFYGMGNSYTDFNLSNIRGVELIRHPEKIRYLCYALAYDTAFAVLALGVFPVLLPLALFDKNKKESWLFLFLFVAFVIGCAAIAYTITLPEELGKRSPRQHLRYLEPLAIPFYILMIQRLKQTAFSRTRKKVLLAAIVLFTMVFVILGAGGGSSLVDNNMLVYYEFFARFICKSDKVLLFVRLLMAMVLAAGCWMLWKNKDTFLKWFAVLFIMVNFISSAAGYFASVYRYAVDEKLRTQTAQANAFLQTLEGNILFITDDGWESEDSRLFDTYVDRDFYVAEIDTIAADGFLKDAVLDLKTAAIRCNFPYKYYDDLSQVDYLVVKTDYGIGFWQETVEKVAEFPLEGYTLYKNRKPDEIWFQK